MIEIKELNLSEMPTFWKQHIQYLISDDILKDIGDIEYFKGNEYRSVIECHMKRIIDRHHVVYFLQNDKSIGAAQYCTYQSEDGKCFILDFWVFPEYRGNGMGLKCVEALENYTQMHGAEYYEINACKENSVRFWKRIGYVENGIDEFGEKLFIKRHIK